MISKKAKEYLQSCKYEMEDCSGNPSYLVPIEEAEKAIELTEEEMNEKAGEVFSEYCEMYAGDGKCLEGGKCEDCDRVKKFKQKLMKQ